MSSPSTPFPLLLREALSKFGDATDRWWAQLDERQRRDVIELWESAQHGGQPPEAFVCAHPAGREEPAQLPATWHSDFYDYLVNHELRYAEEKKFHICTQHPQAKAAIHTGLIPAGYVCPLANADCPMQHLQRALGGNPVRLGVAFGAHA